jgi:Autographiviridae endonuclease VII
VRRCTGCGELKPLTAFHASKWRKTRRRCKDCRRERKYGLTAEAYRALLARQKGKCAICRRKRNLVVDHNHTTGVVRGLICQPCNMGIGGLEDDVILLRRAIKYLNKEGK